MSIGAMPENGKLNILLVDDQPAKLLSYQVILEDLGEVLLTASSGREAVYWNAAFKLGGGPDDRQSRHGQRGARQRFESPPRYSFGDPTPRRKQIRQASQPGLLVIDDHARRALAWLSAQSQEAWPHSRPLGQRLG